MNIHSCYLFDKGGQKFLLQPNPMISTIGFWMQPFRCLPNRGFISPLYRKSPKKPVSPMEPSISILKIKTTSWSSFSAIKQSWCLIVFGRRWERPITPLTSFAISFDGILRNFNGIGTWPSSTRPKRTRSNDWPRNRSKKCRICTRISLQRLLNWDSKRGAFEKICTLGW